MNRRRVASVAVAAALVLAAGVWSAARYHAGYPLNPIDLFGRDTSAEGRRELRALRKDPVLDVRAPETRLRRSTEVAAARDWKNAGQPTELRRLFTLTGEPGTAVELYRTRAEAAGWQLHDVRCSFGLRSTSVRMTRSVGGRPVTLLLYGYLERPPPDSPHRGLLVSVEGEAPSGRPDGAEGARAGPARRALPTALRPHESRPRRAGLQPASSAALCGLLTLVEARRIVPALTVVKPTVDGGTGCRYAAGAGPGFYVAPAVYPRAYYQDRRSPHDPGDRRFVLVDHDTTGPPESVWVDTGIGPVHVHSGVTPTRPGLDARQLVALAELLGRR